MKGVCERVERQLSHFVIISVLLVAYLLIIFTYALRCCSLVCCFLPRRTGTCSSVVKKRMCAVVNVGVSSRYEMYKRAVIGR